MKTIKSLFVGNQSSIALIKKLNDVQVLTGLLILLFIFSCAGCSSIQSAPVADYGRPASVDTQNEIQNSPDFREKMTEALKSQLRNTLNPFAAILKTLAPTLAPSTQEVSNVRVIEPRKSSVMLSNMTCSKSTKASVSASSEFAKSIRIARLDSKPACETNVALLALPASK